MIQAKAAAAASAKAPSGAGSRGNKANHEQPAESQKPKSSTLPANFFENQGMKRHSDGESNKHALPSVCAKFKDSEKATGTALVILCSHLLISFYL